MNKHSATKKRPAKTVRPPAARKASPKVSRRRQSARPAAARLPEQKKNGVVQNGAVKNGVVQLAAAIVGRVTVTPIAATVRTHKFRVGQTVFYTSSPISRPGASGSYQVVRLLPSDGEDYQYRIRNPGEAFERVAKESQLELENS